MERPRRITMQQGAITRHVDEPITPAIPEGLFDLARMRWLDDCRRHRWPHEPPSAAGSVVGPLVIELRSDNGHLATYRYSTDYQYRRCLSAPGYAEVMDFCVRRVNGHPRPRC